MENSNLEIHLQNQIDILKKDLEGLKERKLVIYKMNPKQYAEGIDSDEWITNPYFYYRAKKNKEDFEIVLIGLDGGTKLRQNKLLTLEKLFTLIDGMPMRKLEHRKNNLLFVQSEANA